MPNSIINDFGQTVAPASVVSMQRGYITLPRTAGYHQRYWFGPPDYAAEDGYTPDCAAKYNFSLPTHVTFKPVTLLSLPTDSIYAIVANLVVCVSWRAAGSHVVNRYILHKSLSDNPKVPYPDYAGQKIQKNFSLEIWGILPGDIDTGPLITYFLSKIQPKPYRDSADTYEISSGTLIQNMECYDVGGNIPVPIIFTSAQAVQES